MKTATLRVTWQGDRPWPKGTTVFIGAEDGTEWYVKADDDLWWFDPEQTTGLFGQDDETPDTFVVDQFTVDGNDVVYTFEY